MRPPSLPPIPADPRASMPSIPPDGGRSSFPSLPPGWDGGRASLPSLPIIKQERRRMSGVALSIVVTAMWVGAGAAVIRGVRWFRPKKPAEAAIAPAAAVLAKLDDSSHPPEDEAPPPPVIADDITDPPTLEEQREELFKRMAAELDVTDEQLDAVKAIIEASPLAGQGNPKKTRHPMTRAECKQIREAAGLKITPHPPCDRKSMVPIYDPDAGETAKDAKVCIDQFEFPNIPCEYPVVQVRAREAHLICKAIGKRICDAHEWEGACAGAVHAPDVEYVFGKERSYATWYHNQHREIRWAYGPEKNHLLCATQSHLTPGCEASIWQYCGTNTYPAGSFPACVSPFGVYDQHGNAAEHMNLPILPEQLASRGGTGYTEMKGSWFIFATTEAHEDDCRWRAKDWHPSTLMDEQSHRNYHLGFRCCADLGGTPEPEPTDGGASDAGMSGDTGSP